MGVWGGGEDDKGKKVQEWVEQYRKIEQGCDFQKWGLWVGGVRWEEIGRFGKNGGWGGDCK